MKNFEDFEEINNHLHSELGYYREPGGFSGDAVNTQKLQKAHEIISAYMVIHPGDYQLCEQLIENIENDNRYKDASSSQDSSLSIFPEDSASLINIPASNLSVREQAIVDGYVNSAACTTKAGGDILFVTFRSILARDEAKREG
jgi:hypothetical protein